MKTTHYKVVTKYEDFPVAFGVKDVYSKEDLVDKVSKGLGRIEFIDSFGHNIFRDIEYNGHSEVIAWSTEEDRGITLLITKGEFKEY